MKNHPCLSCGACCAFFTVRFSSQEKKSNGGFVPDEFASNLDHEESVLLGTKSKKPRCMALLGEIGKTSACLIYQDRPSCCRQFEANLENGKIQNRCSQARIAHGLPVLTKEDWTENLDLGLNHEIELKQMP